MWPFTKKPTIPPHEIKLPKIGEKWYLKADDGDPWGRKDYEPVTILDVKDSWVRYKFPGHMFQDERMKMSTFVRIYQKG